MKQDVSGVWILRDHTTIGYSDGTASDAYLHNVFEAVGDLSSRSEELQGYIRDWPSEYHLTRKRSQLLSGFSFDRRQRVLEVGCGCGSISRFLGETFDEVVSIEGDLSRAKLARLRTRDLDNVTVVCAPFQSIAFTGKFDVIFCIGVFEYSGLFVSGEHPYESIIDYFSDVLSDEGVIVLAIENQFGLKYFCGADEDHSGSRFDGIEGYVRNPGRARTFGKRELADLLGRHFPHQQFYYPYPDYKVPDAVLSEDFLASGRAGEVISQVRSRNYSGNYRPLWLEATAVAELNRNRLLDVTANSFLVVAGKSAVDRISFAQQGVLYSPARRSQYAIQTRFVQGEDGELQVTKQRLWAGASSTSSRLRQHCEPSNWIDAPSLQTELVWRSARNATTLADIFAPAQTWVDALRAAAVDPAGHLPGAFLDSIWGNTYLVEGRCNFIDQEWEWHEQLSLGTILVRAAFDFIDKSADLVPKDSPLRARSGRRLITEIAQSLGVRLSQSDFDAFVDIESEVLGEVFGIDRTWARRYLRWYLFDRVSLQIAKRVKDGIALLRKRLRRALNSRLTIKRTN